MISKRTLYNSKVDSQINIDNLSLSIKDVKKQSKFLEDLVFELHESQKGVLTHKKALYQQILNSAYSNHLGYNYFPLVQTDSITDFIFHIGIDHKEEKRKILEEIILVIDALSFSINDVKLNHRLIKLERTLERYLNSFDKILLYGNGVSSWQIYSDCIAELYIKSNLSSTLRKIRFSLRNAYFKLYLRDIKFFFRQIMRFRFKNMNADLEDANSLSSKLIKLLVKHSIFIQNGYRRNYTAFR